MNTENGNLDTAIRFAGATRDAMAAGNVWVDYAHLAKPKAGDARGIEDLYRQLVAHHSRVAEVRVLALIDMKIGTTDPDAQWAHQGFVLAPHRDRARSQLQTARLDAYQHGNVFHLEARHEAWEI